MCFEKEVCCSWRHTLSHLQEHLLWCQTLITKSFYFLKPSSHHSKRKWLLCNLFCCQRSFCLSPRQMFTIVTFYEFIIQKKNLKVKSVSHLKSLKLRLDATRWPTYETAMFYYMLSGFFSAGTRVLIRQNCSQCPVTFLQCLKHWSVSFFINVF